MNFEEFIKKYNLKLNEKQKKAVKEIKGPVLLLAVPGSGKTTVLVARTGYMIYCKGVNPENILTLTYTRAAAFDMKNRFISFFGNEYSSKIQFRTINGICAKILIYFREITGRKPFSLAVNEHIPSEILTHAYISSENRYPLESDIKGMKTDITYIKNMNLNYEEIKLLEDERDYGLYYVYKNYQENMQKKKLMDYDDQMVYALKILKKYPDILSHFQNMYTYICVDEAQDTSKIQHEIISLLAGKSKNIFMVGDEDQSIYGFRAAYPNALLDFKKTYPDSLIITMDINYRSDEYIVKLADKFIQKNKGRYDKSMHAARKGNTPVKYVDVKNMNAQYIYLSKIAQNCDRQTACLYRNNESAIPLADILERNNISYTIKNDDFSFFTHKTIMDIRNIAAFSKDPKNTEIFMGIYYKLKTYLNREKAERACFLSKKFNMDILDAAIRKCSLEDYERVSLRRIKDDLESLKTENAKEALKTILYSMGYSFYLERNKIKDTKISILKSLSLREDTIYSLVERLDEIKDILKTKSFNPHCPFILSTVHKSKGLEYDRVYIYDVKDGILPECNQDNPSYEEERRLFYVAMTRAKDELNILRLPYDSSFTKELGALGKKKKENISISPENDIVLFKKGSRVYHNKWKEGKIISFNDDKVTIRFESGEKTLLFKFAVENGYLRLLSSH